MHVKLCVSHFARKGSSVKYNTTSCPCEVCMLLVDGFHGVFLSLYIESSHFWIPLRQQLALSLSVANGFLIESPQVVYLFVEVKRGRSLVSAMLLFLSFHSEPQKASSSVCKCHPLSVFDPTAPHLACY